MCTIVHFHGSYNQNTKYIIKKTLLDSDDVVGSFGEEVCNSNGTKLKELMQQSDLVLWNNREFCIEPQ